MKNKESIFGYLIYIIFLIVISFVIYQFYLEAITKFNLFYISAFCLVVYCCLYILVYPIVSLNSKVKKFYEKVLGLPLIILINIMKGYLEILAILMFLFSYFVPTTLVDLFVSDDSQYKMGILYLMNIIAVMIFAYGAKKIVLFINFTSDKYKHELLNKLIQRIDFRLISYAMMIMIYMFYNFNYFTNESLGIDIEGSMAVLKEVFVTFIAIDSFIQIFKRDKGIRGQSE